MSCDYDLWCLYCGDPHNFYDWNYGEKELHALLRYADFFAHMAETWERLKKEPNVWLEPRLTLQHDNHPVSPTWFQKHRGHKLAVRDEYGRIHDECAETFNCGECKNQRWCRRLKGHEPPHSEHRDDGGKT